MQFFVDRPRLLAALTWWPAVYMALFFALWLVLAVSMTAGAGLAAVAEGTVGEGAGGAVATLLTLGGFALFPLLFVLHLFTMVEMVAIVAVYVLLVLRDEALDSNERLMWMLIVLLAGTLGQLLYYYQRHRPALA
ncbi:MAG: hypothetical protein ABMA64_32100 [Myxococcota bacterium]